MASTTNENLHLEVDSDIATKRLRFSDPDLRILLKYADDGNPVEKEYLFYSQVVAKLSKFVDIALSVEMKEKETRTIVIPDVPPDVFDTAMKFLEDPSASRSMTEKDALEVAEFYDKYEFSLGVKLCDDVMHEYILKQERKSVDQPPDDLQLLIDCFVMADKINLAESKEVGLYYLQSKMDEWRVPFGRTMFTEDHFRTLHPLFKSAELDLPIYGLTKEEIHSTLFPKLAVKAIWVEYYYERDEDSSLVKYSSVKLSKATRNADGVYNFNGVGGYSKNATGRWDEENLRYQMCKQHDDDSNWAIVGFRLYGDPITLWKCPYSANLPYPPEKGWVPVHKLAEGNPTIEYVCDD